MTTRLDRKRVARDIADIDKEIAEAQDSHYRAFLLPRTSHTDPNGANRRRIMDTNARHLSRLELMRQRLEEQLTGLPPDPELVDEEAA